MSEEEKVAVANPAAEAEVILDVKDLTVRFKTEGGYVDAVINESFQIRSGETLALVGESGSGKSVTSLSVMRLVEHGGGRIAAGSINLRKRDGSLVDLASVSEKTLRKIRGNEVAMIFQEPMTSLNPVFQVGSQIAESLWLHGGISDPAQKVGEQIAEQIEAHSNVSHQEALAEAVRLLKLVRIPLAERVSQRYPHQLSGGMRQRVMIAMALACRPRLLIADEPTTALDVTVQAQILSLIDELQKKFGMAVLFITHDMGVVAQVADRVAVMRYGKIVEMGPSKQIFESPQHPYTKALLAAVPRLGSMSGTDKPDYFKLVDPDSGTAVSLEGAKVSDPGDTILVVKDIVKAFPARTSFFGTVTHRVHATHHVSFDLRSGETLSIVGESGCGKSTTGRCVMRLIDIDSGDILFRGESLVDMGKKSLQIARRNIQMIFQDPYASLDPRLTIGFSIAEPLLVHKVCTKAEAMDHVAELLRTVELSPDLAGRYPHEFSGGQRQRICIARALAMKPQIIVADESVAALDVSIRAGVVNLMLKLQEEMGISYIFISHDMGVVERISHRVAVMYLGQIVEIGTRAQVFENPCHAYTRKLLSAVPVADPAMRNRKRELDLTDLPSPVRHVDDPPPVSPLVEVEPGHMVAQHVIGDFM